jgi:hypothetical protein
MNPAHRELPHSGEDSLWQFRRARRCATEAESPLLRSGNARPELSLARKVFGLLALPVISSAVDCSTAGDGAFGQMRWVRTNRRCGSWLALAAMALQLVLSFGHLHLDKFALGSVAATAAHAKATASKTSPAQHPANDADDYCAICATIHLTTGSFLPEVPPLPVPFISQAIEHFDHTTSLFIPRPQTAFQSRAPPLA